MIQICKNILGNIDIYLFDQILKGSIQPQYKYPRCWLGEAVALIYFLQQWPGESFGVDENFHGFEQVAVSCKVATREFNGNFLNIAERKTPSPNEMGFDVVLCSAVLGYLPLMKRTLSDVGRDMESAEKKITVCSACLASANGPGR